MEQQKRFLSGMATGVSSVVLRTCLNVALIPILLHTLGTDDYGLYVILLGILECALALDLGFSMGIVTLLGHFRSLENNEKAAEILCQGHVVYASMALLITGIGLFAIPSMIHGFHIPLSMTTTAGISMVIILLEATISLYASFYQAVLLTHCRHQWSHVGDTLSMILANGLGIVMILAGWGLIPFLGIRLLAAFLRLLFMAHKARQCEPDILTFKPQTLQWKNTQELLKMSFHSMMRNLSVIVSHKIDSLVIAAFLTLQAVSTYEIVFRFLNICLQVGLKIGEGAFPVFIQSATLDQKDKSRFFFLRVSCFNNFVVSALLLLILFYYPQLFHVFSAGKIPIGPTFPVLAIATVCVWSGALQIPATNYLYGSGRHRYMTISSLIAAAANLGLSLVFVHYWGIVGVALGTLIPQLLQHQLSLIRTSCKDLHIGFWEYVETVHLKLFIPLGSLFVWLTLGQTVRTEILPQSVFLAMGLLSLTGILFSSGLWLIFCTSPEEKALIKTYIYTPLKQKLLPIVGI